MPKEVFILAIVGMVGSFILTATALRAFIRSRENQAPVMRDDRLDQIARQLETLQQSLDATALEVERLGEGQRFTTKLLAERGPVASPARQPERVVTPH